MLTLLNVINQIFTVGSPFTATVSGPWNDGATWGNASPGIKGTDWPGLANNVATINAGVVVGYNVSEVNALGNVTVNGTLWFPLNQTTLLSLAHVNLTIGATGSMFTSSDGTVGNIGDVNVANTLTITFATTADNTKGIVITNGAYVQMRGNSALYGGSHSTTLFADWNAGQTFTATGAAPLAWTNGQMFTIATNVIMGAVMRFTIANRVANGLNTDITIVEAAPGILFSTGGNIEYERRNILILKVTALLPAMGTVYANRPTISDNHVTGTIIWRNVIFTGLYVYNGNYLQTGGTFEMSDVIFRNGRLGFSGICFCTLTGCNGYSNDYYGFSSNRFCTLTGCNGYSNGRNGYDNLQSCTLTACNGYSNTISGFELLITCTLTACNSYSNNSLGFDNLLSCTLTACNTYINAGGGFYRTTSCTLTACNVYSNSFGWGLLSLISCKLINCMCYDNFIGIETCYSLVMLDGSIGWNGAISLPNAFADFSFPNEARLQNIKVPLAGLVFLNTNLKTNGNILCEDYNKTPASWRNYQGFATITKIASPAGFKSANCLLVEPLSNISIILPATIYNWFNNGLAIYLPNSAVKISVFVLGENWVVFPTNAELYLEVSYLAGVTAQRTAIKSVQVIAANNVVTELSVTIVPGQAGIAYARMIFAKYETNSTHRINIDSVIGINDGVSDTFEYCDDGFKPIWNGRNVKS